MQNDPQQWFKELPPITKCFLVAIFVFTLGMTIGLISPYDLIFTTELVLQRLQVWRLISNMLYIQKFSYGWIIHMYLWTNFSTNLERDVIFTQSSPGAYLWFILIQAALLNALNLVFFWPMGKPMLTNSLLFAVIYYWSKRDPWGPVTIYFVTVKGYQLPFALLFLHLLMGANIWDDLMGLASGHTYYYLKDVLPLEQSLKLLPECPKFLDRLMLKFTPERPQQTPSTNTQQTSWFERNLQDTMRRRNTSNSNEPFSGPGRRLGGPN